MDTMLTHNLFFLAATSIAVLMVGRSPVLGGEAEFTVFTDADATVQVVCRNDNLVEECMHPKGADTITGLHPAWGDTNFDHKYVRVHNSNAQEAGYFHFDLSGIDAGSQISEARFQLDTQTNSWSDNHVTVVSIVDPGQDWNLNALPENMMFGGNAPMADWGDWDGESDDDRRVSRPQPFLQEGEGPDAATRLLVPAGEFITIKNQDRNATGTLGSPGNSYGGVVFENSNTNTRGGAADGQHNAWPVKNALDLDITSLITWKLGQNAAYSEFEPKDGELTIMVRTFAAGLGNGFTRFVSKESDFLGGELDLAPGRIVLSGDIVTSIPELPQLQAGDADQDLDFDQSDLVKVLIAAKYLSGQPATWGEGDWNGAPGGKQGSPPAGNGLFDQLDVVAALSGANYLNGPYAAGLHGENAENSSPSVVYDSATGEIAINSPVHAEFTSINIESAAGIFAGDDALNLGGSFDNDSDNNLFKATFGSSFSSLSFGRVARSGLSEDMLLNDLTVIGSLADGSGLGDVQLIYVPEPSAWLLAVVGLSGIFSLGYHRHRHRI
jgi:hypothetical protein